MYSRSSRSINPEREEEVKSNDKRKVNKQDRLLVLRHNMNL